MIRKLRQPALALLLPALVPALACTATRASLPAEDETRPPLAGRVSEGMPDFLRAGEAEDAEELDLTGDGRPNVVRVFSLPEGEGEPKLRRKAVDLNNDGLLDVWTWYADDGAVVKQAFDLDFDGRADVTAHFANGRLVRKELYQGVTTRPNAFKYYENGKLVRVERDRTADGRIDTWEYWEGDRLDRVGVDVTGDGTVDRWTKHARADD